MTKDPNFKSKLLRLIKLIDKIKAQLTATHHSYNHSRPLLEAIDEIKAILETTEASTTSILSAVEEISALCQDKSPEFTESINKHVFEILEASNYQDINSQRLVKIINILKEIYLSYSQDSPMPGHETEHISTTSSLLNGPQLPDKAPSQQEVDDIFSQ